MEDLHQDPEKVIQQLRLLLATREEELNKLRGQLDSGENQEASESVTDQLMQELEEKKAEVSELHKKMKDLKAKAEEKLSKAADQLEEKEKLISSLKSGLPEPPSEGAPQDPEEIEWAKAEIDRLSGELTKATVTIADLKASADDEERAQAEVEELRQELAKSGELYEQNIFELKKNIETLQEERDDAISAASQYQPGGGVGIPAGAHPEAAEESVEILAAKDEELSDANSRLREFKARLEMVEEDLDKKERLYRTAQARLHKLGRTQLILRGACGVLSVFLVLLLSMNIKRSATPNTGEASFVEPAIADTANVQVAAVDESVVSKEDTDGSGEEAIFMLAEKSPEVETEETTEAEAERIAYTVKKGDSLWLICQRQLGDPSATQQVAMDNNLRNPNTLQVGDVIYLSRR